MSAIKAIMFPPRPRNIPGLIHAECMLAMTLGARITSPSRILVRQVVLFAQWENEFAIDQFLQSNWLGKILIHGWHTRLIFVRQWGTFENFTIPDANLAAMRENSYAVAVTIARMKFTEIPRFIRWGRPVEELVRDHPGTTLSLASIRFPNTVSTFSIWRNHTEMTDMVHGRSSVQNPDRHAKAMQERDRRNFHFEFTTLRFKPISEYGKWDGKTNFTDKQ